MVIIHNAESRKSSGEKLKAEYGKTGLKK